MPSNYTPNYQLNQWEPEDRILRMDFNADNAKIEEELSNLRRTVNNMAYHLGQLSLVDMEKRETRFCSRAVFYTPFLAEEIFQCSSGVVYEDGVFKLSGIGNSGTVSASYTFFGSPIGSKRLKIWVHHSGGNISVSINGVSAVPAEIFADYSTHDGSSCICSAFTCETQVDHDFTFTIGLDCGRDSSMSVLDFVMAYL